MLLMMLTYYAQSFVLCLVSYAVVGIIETYTQNFVSFILTSHYRGIYEILCY